MKWRILLTLVLGLSLRPQTVRSATLLVNGDAESGTLAGWATNYSQLNPATEKPIASVTSQAQTSGTVLPQQGQRFFSFAYDGGLQTGSRALMYQTGTNGLDGATLVLSGYVQTETLGNPTDSGEAVLVILDNSSNVLASVSSGTLYTTNSVWKPFQVGLQVLSGAKTWRVELYGTINYGTYINVFYDALQLMSTREQLAISAWPVALYWNSMSSVSYQLQYRSNLTGGAWLDLGTPASGTGTTNWLYDLVGRTVPQRFYRVVRLP